MNEQGRRNCIGTAIPFTNWTFGRKRKRGLARPVPSSLMRSICIYGTTKAGPLVILSNSSTDVPVFK